MENRPVQEVIMESPTLSWAIQVAMENDIRRFRWGSFEVFLTVVEQGLTAVRLTRTIA